MELIPYLCVKNASEAIDFYKRAFGAEETMRLAEPDGRIGHAEMKIGDAMFMLSDEYPDFQSFSPVTIGGTPVMLHLVVPDANSAFEKAVAAGATVDRPLKDEFYGMRSASLRDPYGHRWMIASYIEKLDSKEVERRYSELMKKGDSK